MLILRPPLLVGRRNDNVNGHTNLGRRIINRQIIGLAIFIQTAEHRDQLRRCDQHILFRRLSSLIHIKILVLEADRVVLARLLVPNNCPTQIETMNDLDDLILDLSADYTAASISSIIQNAGQIEFGHLLNHLDIFADHFGGAYTTKHTVILEFIHAHGPGREPNLGIVDLTQLPANRLGFGVGLTLDNALGASLPLDSGQRTQSDRIRSETTRSVQTGIEFGNSSSVGIKIEQPDGSAALLLCDDGDQHRDHCVHTAHLAGIQILDLLVMQQHCLLECIKASHSIRAKGAILLDFLRRPQAGDHRAISGISFFFSDLVHGVQVNGIRTRRLLFQQFTACIQRATATCAKESRSNHDVVNFVSCNFTRHLEDLLKDNFCVQHAQQFVLPL